MGGGDSCTCSVPPISTPAERCGRTASSCRPPPCPSRPLAGSPELSDQLRSRRRAGRGTVFDADVRRYFDEQFEHCVDLEIDECVHWPFTRDLCRYGRPTVEGAPIGAHVLAAGGAATCRPPGDAGRPLACGDASCFNPGLCWGTAAENRADAIRQAPCLRGLLHQTESAASLPPWGVGVEPSSGRRATVGEQRADAAIAWRGRDVPGCAGRPARRRAWPCRPTLLRITRNRRRGGLPSTVGAESALAAAAPPESAP